jgi:DHA1 family bicyclomycin/chloramphenicol resistance-like MFS transporter
MTSRFLRLAVVLGLITAVGPFAIDMYLPALPSIGATLGASPGAVQLSLMAFFITLGVCQLVYGPLSDMLGRKGPIYFGLTVFILGSVGCALAPNVEVLIAFRVIQAIGACAGMVVPRAIVRDLHTGADATRLMALLMLVVSISPILAPLVGSGVISAFGWRGVFWAVCVAAVIGLVLATTQLQETRLPAARLGSSWGSALASYRELIVDPTFMGLTFVGSFGISAFFVYLANSSFVLINHYGLTPAQYSLCFGLNAVAFFGFAQLTGRFTERFGLVRLIRGAVTVFAAMLVLLFAVFAAGIEQLWVMASMLFVACGFLGLVIPTTAVLSLEAHGEIAGTASALLGATQMITGAAVMAASGFFATGKPLPMVAGMAACGVVAFLIAQGVLRPVRVQVAA